MKNGQSYQANNASGDTNNSPIMMFYVKFTKVKWQKESIAKGQPMVMKREPLGSNQIHASAVEDLTSVDSPQRKRLRNSKGSDDGSEKSKGKKEKDTMLANLVSVREEEMQTYKEMKTKQIDSYKEIKMAQMERNDPKNDPYGMPNCKPSLL